MSFSSIGEWKTRSRLSRACQQESAQCILTPNEGGIDQMRRILAGYADLDSIQVVSHGGEGAIELGNSLVDAAA